MSAAERDRYGTHRNIDPSVGLLGGEGSQQRVKEERERRLALIAEDAWTSAATATAPVRGDTPTYYDRPAIKEPAWRWYIPAYYFTGGAAGAASLIGAVAQATGGAEMRGLVVRCRWLSTAGLGAGTYFLIADLGRPERFYNMLRVFRPTSPLNLGSWLLAAAGPLIGTSAVLARRGGALRAVGDVAGYGAGLLGPVVSTYTAVLTSNNSIPVWAEAHRTLPALFAASSLASATSLLGMQRLEPRAALAVRRLARIGKLAELVAASAVQREASRVERVGLPFRHGLSGALWRTSKACTAAGLLASLLPPTRRWHVAAGVLGAAGALASRFAIWQAGFASARDPRATFEMQRAGRGAAEVTGTAGITGPGGERATE